MGHKEQSPSACQTGCQIISDTPRPYRKRRSPRIDSSCEYTE